MFVPWIPRYTEDELREAIGSAQSWSGVLEHLGLQYHGKTIATARKWAQNWLISTDHLSDLPGPQRRIQYSDDELLAAVAAARSWAEALRSLGYCPTGGNWRTLKRKCLALGISADHFDPHAATRAANRKRSFTLEEILVEHSTYSRSNLKRRLYAEGLKQRVCELCGQGEVWNGHRIGLILDHINGVRDDHRLENLRIVCPNCAAGLETHCGRKNRMPPRERACAVCGENFEVRYTGHRFCSIQCAGKGKRSPQRGVPVPQRRKVPRPPRNVLEAEVEELGFSAVGRKYGVSDNAIRKWLAWYDREAA